MDRHVDSARLIDALTRQIGALAVECESLRLVLGQREEELTAALKALEAMHAPEPE